MGSCPGPTPTTTGRILRSLNYPYYEATNKSGISLSLAEILRTEDRNACFLTIEYRSHHRPAVHSFSTVCLLLQPTAEMHLPFRIPVSMPQPGVVEGWWESQREEAVPSLRRRATANDLTTVVCISCLLSTVASSGRILKLKLTLFPPRPLALLSADLSCSALRFWRSESFDPGTRTRSTSQHPSSSVSGRSGKSLHTTPTSRYPTTTGLMAHRLFDRPACARHRPSSRPPRPRYRRD